MPNIEEMIPQLLSKSRSLFSDYHHAMKRWEETVHALVVMHDWKQQKQLEETIRDVMRLAVERAELEGYQQGYEDGKRRAVN
jgi:hypothetical protein